MYSTMRRHIFFVYKCLIINLKFIFNRILKLISELLISRIVLQLDGLFPHKIQNNGVSWNEKITKHQRILDLKNLNYTIN